MAREINPKWPPPAYEPTDDVDTTAPAERGSRRGVWLAAVVVIVGIGAVIVAFAGMHRKQLTANPTPAPTMTIVPPSSSSAGADDRAGPCGPDEATAVRSALGQLPPDPTTGRPWSGTPEQSNYDPCADLSAVLVTVQGATNSSPDQALMFHRGEFVGTATPAAYPFTDLVGPASTDDIVVLTYRTLQSCDTCEDGTLTIVGFQWRGDHVRTLDPLPELRESPP
ncbi:LppP/LprE family lipoprotein [Mycobacterium spongiae]|uniref:LppP/LprE family lipoprotein n=1 Tax=Mycobacterium spongiae TaxID=886343 RepID=A0A975K0F6_9MYCO|nr:LppP/LprE family lipoprotein [Mycobacterium spongiae]QUR69052.1 LppP/LprE family lipoprotein [Mycobacterium spongiae]